MTEETYAATGGKVSDPGTKMDEQDMDTMVARASVPNLASLFKKGKDAGLIKPTSNYGESA